VKNIIVALILIGSPYYSFASFVETAAELDGTSGKLKNTVFGLFKSHEDEYLDHAKKAKAVLCERDASFKILSAQNIWSEIQAISKIQKSTTLKFIKTCSQTTVGNREFCEKMQPKGSYKPELLKLYEEILGCAYSRIEERAPVLAQKLRKNKVLSCTTSIAPKEANALLGSEVYFVNTNYATTEFEEIRNQYDLYPTLCKVDGKIQDLKIILEGNAFVKCIATQPTFATCLKQKCSGKIDGYCIDKYKEACIAHLQDKDDYLASSINKCYMEEVRNPTNPKTLKAKQECNADNDLSQLDIGLMQVGSGVASSCDRKIKNFIAAVSNAFSLREETLCNSSPNNSSGNSNSAGSK